MRNVSVRKFGPSPLTHEGCAEALRDDGIIILDVPTLYMTGWAPAFHEYLNSVAIDHSHFVETGAPDGSLWIYFDPTRYDKERAEAVLAQTK